MKYVIVGSGATGLLLSILLKRNNVSCEVIVLDKNKKVAKKLYATGNGKCNLGNTLINDYVYNDKIALSYLNNFPLGEQRKLLNELGLLTKMNNNLCYPFSESARMFVDSLIAKATSLGVKFLVEKEVTDYDLTKVFLSNGETITYDKLFITVGGHSSPIYGTDGNFNKVLLNHNYKISNVYPGLCPLRTVEKTKEVNGQRIKANVTLLKNDKEIYSDKGEVLFKNDGLSGIVIMNVSSMIARTFNSNNKYKIILDVIPNLNKDDLILNIENNRKNNNLLDGLFTVELSNFISKLLGVNNKSSNDEIINKLKSLTFNFKELYDFKDSQVTVGGLLLENINVSTLESKIESNIYFGGEILNLDGLCGGYNLMLCFAIAYTLSKNC